MTKIKFIQDKLYSGNQLYSDNQNNITAVQEERVSQTPSPTQHIIISPVSSAPSSPTESLSSPTTSSPTRTATVDTNEINELQKLSIIRLLKEVMDAIEKKRYQSIPPDLVESLITELSIISNKSINKKGTKKKRERGSIRICSKCGTDSTPEWRRSPEGSTTLCNACGLKEKKRAKNSSTNSGGSHGSNRFHHSNISFNTSTTIVPGQTLPIPNYEVPYVNQHQLRSSASSYQQYRNQDVAPNYRVPSIPPMQPNTSLYYPVSDSPYQFYPTSNHGVVPNRPQSSFDSSECKLPNCYCTMNNTYYDVPSVPFHQV
eukprot:TRINITY_DN17641_c0_g1_i1.p1 TRINITY_DN17641_c0_g1~~TRINITY_DN17641_c0_g1_i1.p1  ORF type:complete len:316 (-),score=29.45 TRINITY_DN17641_c0_g1_i1:70-1017(-)